MGVPEEPAACAAAWERSQCLARNWHSLCMWSQMGVWGLGFFLTRKSPHYSTGERECMLGAQEDSDRRQQCGEGQGGPGGWVRALPRGFRREALAFPPPLWNLSPVILEELRSKWIPFH